MHGTVRSSSKDGKTRFFFHSREGARYTEGIENSKLIKNALAQFPEISGISEILEGAAILNGSSRSQTIQMHGIIPANHIMVSDLDKQIIRGKLSVFELDPMTILIGNRIAERLMLQVGDSVNLQEELETYNYEWQGYLRRELVKLIKTECMFTYPPQKLFLVKGFRVPYYNFPCSIRLKPLILLHKFKKLLDIEQ